MRNFDACKQEILRRAQVRICRRKKVQKTLLGIGIPAVCLALALGVCLPREETLDAMDAVMPQNQKFAESSVADSPAAAAPVEEAITAAASAADAAPLEDHTHKDAPAEPQPWEIPPENHLVGIPGETFTQYEGVCVQADEINAARGSMLFDFWNQSGEDAYLDSFDIVRWEEDQWISCAIDGENWRSEPQWLPSYPDEAAVGKSVTWKNFDFTQPGIYRFIGTFRVGEDETTYTMYAEFSLTEGE